MMIYVILKPLLCLASCFTADALVAIADPRGFYQILACCTA
ncbi:MAG TPA: hypothetical protein VHY08_08760 [Bacillota bacterium]|nr:hypothetical protein [Bacillota bacterium]